MSSKSSSTTGGQPTVSAAKKANLPMRTAALSGSAASQQPSTSSGSPAQSRKQLATSSAHAPSPSGNALPRASGGLLVQQNKGVTSQAPGAAQRAPSAQQPPSRQEQGSGKNTTAPPGGNVRHSPSKSLQKKEEEFQVVKAPTMLKGEKPAPTSGPLFTLVRARAKALEMGQCKEKY